MSFTPTYITVDEIKENTRLEELGRQSSSFLLRLVEEAEEMIDAYCGFWARYDQDQDRTFPRLCDYKDGATLIPRAVQKAALAQVEALYLRGPEEGLKESEMKSEKIDDYSYQVMSANDKQNLLCRKARLLLSGYVRRTGNLTY